MTLIDTESPCIWAAILSNSDWSCCCCWLFSCTDSFNSFIPCMASFTSSVSWAMFSSVSSRRAFLAFLAELSSKASTSTVGHTRSIRLSNRRLWRRSLRCPRHLVWRQRIRWSWELRQEPLLHSQHPTHLQPSTMASAPSRTLPISAIWQLLGLHRNPFFFPAFRRAERAEKMQKLTTT